MKELKHSFFTALVLFVVANVMNYEKVQEIFDKANANIIEVFITNCIWFLWLMLLCFLLFKTVKSLFKSNTNKE